MTVIEQIELWATTYPKTFALVTAALTLLLTQLWTKYKNRIAVLTWTANHQRHGTSLNHPTIGAIAVTVNGSAARALFLTTVRVTNTSTRDLSDLDVELELPIGSTLVDSEGVVEQSLSALMPTQRWMTAAADARARWTEQTQDAENVRARVARWRAYRLPALNRQSSATFTFFWENAQNLQPFIVTSCTHAGVRMVFRKLLPPQSILFGVPIAIAAPVGIAIGSALLIAFAPSWLYFLPFALGVLVTVLGVAVIWTGRMLAKLFN
jgi:hypothetical protein